MWKHTFGLFKPMVHVKDHQLQHLIDFDGLFSHKGEEEVISFCGKKGK